MAYLSLEFPNEKNKCNSKKKSGKVSNHKVRKLSEKMKSLGELVKKVTSSSPIHQGAVMMGQLR